MLALRAPVDPARPVPPDETATAAPRPTFAEVYESSFAFVWRNARRLGAPEATVDDVVQDVFVIVHRILGEFEGRSSLNVWLFGITRNVVREHRRTLQSRHPHALRAEEPVDHDQLVDSAPGPHENAVQAEAARLVDRLLESLDDDKREVFILAELEKRPAAEIGVALGIPLNTVYSRLRLARQAFAAAAARHRARTEGASR
jgi:RNA polymerase sigma-70 factor (ECF subfamily)